MAAWWRRSAPECFPDDKSWFAWRVLARIAPPIESLGPCEDCTPDYQARMVAERMCSKPNIKPGPAKLAAADEQTRLRQYEFLKSNLPKDLSPQEYEDQVRSIASALRI